MSAEQWTKEQWRAITARQHNLLVAAGAGAGKTAVLVERIIRRITDPHDPVDVDRLLVVTFTNAAAAEMRERVAAALAAQLTEHPEDVRLQRQLALLGRASIATLHSFCLDLLRQHFYRLDLDPAFRIADVTEAELLRADVLEQLFEEQYQAEDDQFIELVDSYGGTHDDSELQQIILQLDGYASSHADPEGWLQRLPEQLADETAQASWLNSLASLAKQALAEARTALQNALQIAGEPEGPAQYQRLLADELAKVEQALDQATPDNWDRLRELVQSVTFGRLPSKRGGDLALREQAKAARDQAKAKIKGLWDELMAQSQDQLLQGLTAVTPGMRLLCQLTLEFRFRYAEAKRGKGLVDFNDLEHMALAVLQEDNGRPSAVALELRQRYTEILVDEYQDINGVQEAILQLLADPAGPGGQLFMVGDVKQSIYRFRLADPTLFLQKYQSYGEDPHLGERIDLAHNFRSRPSVLAAVNYLFRQLMTRTVGEMTYDASAELQPGAKYPDSPTAFGPEVEIMLAERTSSPVATEDEEDALAELDATSREARLIALEIRRLVEESGTTIWDKRRQQYRPIAYRDIVILLRATSGRANAFLEQMRELDVPSYAELATGYFQTTEVQTMLSLLQIIDNPRQDIPLAAVLRSPLVGLSGSDLVDIRLAAPAESYYDALLVAKEQTGGLADKLQAFQNELLRWREQARRSSLTDLIWQIYRDTGYYTLVGATPGGAQRQANLRALHDRARQYEQTSFRGLFRFLRFIERLQSEQNDLGTARALGENEDVVRIMSVHKSKGLEFPVVFVGGLGNKFNLQDLSRDLLIHKELGLGPLAVDFERRVRYPTLPRLVIKQQLLLETLSEELRVLYVALTRAREKLYLVGSQRNLPKALDRWAVASGQRRDARGALPAGILAQARCFLDWLVPALLCHPEATPLRQAVDSEPTPLPVIADQSRWRFRLASAAELNTQAVATEQAPELENVRQRRVVPDQGTAWEVNARLGWSYPYAALRGKHIKVSVSELKRRYEIVDEEAAPLHPWQRPAITRPAFMQQEGGLSQAEVGSAIHLLLQHVDLTATPTLAYLKQLQEDLLQQSLLSREEAERIDLKLVASFLQSDLGCRLRRAEQVWRELPFSLRLPADELYGPECSGERVYVQGIVDCIFREGEQAVLLDFKSDHVTKQTIAGRAAAYKVQLDLYARAVDQLFHLPIRERYLYFLRLGQAIRV
jgi:ATP-dependent helicase/nuclease subunit A